MPTTGRPRAQARCSGPVSPAITRLMLRVRAMSCSTEHRPVPPPPAGLFPNRAPAHSSPGPALTSTRKPLLHSACATSAYRSTGQRFAPQPAPGLISTAGTSPLIAAQQLVAQSSAAGSNGKHGLNRLKVIARHRQASSTSCSITCAPWVCNPLREETAVAAVSRGSASPMRRRLPAIRPSIADRKAPCRSSTASYCSGF